MLISTFLELLVTTPDSVDFSDTMAVIDANYQFTETAFMNGAQQNAAGQNNGSCKIFAFALLHNLTPAQALACFGTYYRHDVLQHPSADDHQNIRQFMVNGWQGVNFNGVALTVK